MAENPPAAAGQAAAGLAAAVNPVIFALAPAHAVDGVIDLHSSEGKKLFTSGIKPLSEELYDCTADKMFQFLMDLEDRANMYGWNHPAYGILQIPRDAANPLEGGVDYLIEQYGEISIERIRAFEETYIHEQVRAAQDSFILYNCLMNSLSSEGKQKVLVWKSKYKVREMVSGNLLLKVIITESHLDTNATTSSIRHQLSSLDEYISTIGNDITKFNGHVKRLVLALKSRGQTTEDLLTNLFKAYLEVPDKAFKSYLQRKKESYEDGDDVTPDSLMKAADNKYKMLKQENAWNSISPDEERILALQAQLKALKKKGNKGVEGKKGNKGRQKGNEPKRTEKPESLKKAPPKSKIHSPVKWKGKDWWYCCKETGGLCGGVWRVHKPEECEGKAHKPDKNAKDDGKGDKKRKSEKAPDKRKLKLSKAYAATTGKNDDESSSSGEESKE